MAEKATKPDAPDKGAAARAEKAPKPKKLTFKGIKLTLPAELPPTLLFDFTELEAAGDNPMPLFRLLRSILGPSQFTEIRNAMDTGTLEATDLSGLLEATLGKYGLTPGESSASQST